MKGKFIKVAIFILLILVAVFHSYYLTHLYSHDEIWIYGFASNIVDGLIPYKDYNMVITPLFPYILALILKVFGQKLIIYHIIIALMITSITFLAYKKIKHYAILIFLSLMIYSINGYNTSTLLWLFLLFAILDREDKYKDILVPIIISLMILTKQSLILFVIPSIIYSKNRKKTILVYFIIALLFFIYLIANNNYLEFFDYCLFGMFDFAGSNKLISPIFLVLELFIIVSLIIQFKKSNFSEEILYVLLYQIMVYPILDIYHFTLCWASYLYILFKNNNLNDLYKNTLFIMLAMIELCLIFTTNSMFTLRDIELYEHYPKNTYLEGRMILKNTKEYIADAKNLIERYPEHELYIFGVFSYIIKLDLDIPINKFDLINNGNMGYNGANKYLKELKENCSKKKCLFIVNENEYDTDNYIQTNQEILALPINNYRKIYSTTVYGVYAN